MSGNFLGLVSRRLPSLPQFMSQSPLPLPLQSHSRRAGTAKWQREVSPVAASPCAARPGAGISLSHVLRLAASRKL